MRSGGSGEVAVSGVTRGAAVTWRSAAERLSHRLVVRRRMPAPFRSARIYVSTEGGLRYLRPGMARVDPTLLGLAAEFVRPGAIVWDIGANVGLFSFAAAVCAGRSGRVLAVEPDTWLVGLLRRSVRANRRHAHVEILPAAISDAAGVGRFHIARRSRSSSHLDGFGTTQTGGIRHTQLVPTVTLDRLLAAAPRPDVLKIDVEAAEALVLAGASAVLANRPVIICEVAQENAERVRELLLPFDYLLYDGAVPASERRPLDRAPFMLLALPSPVPASAASAARPPTDRRSTQA